MEYQTGLTSLFSQPYLIYVILLYIIKVYFVSLALFSVLFMHGMEVFVAILLIGTCLVHKAITKIMAQSS